MMYPVNGSSYSPNTGVRQNSKVMDLPIRGEKLAWHPGPLPEEGKSPKEGEKLICQVMLSSSPGPVCSPKLPPGTKFQPITAVISNGSGVQGLAGHCAHGGSGGPAEQRCFVMGHPSTAHSSPQGLIHEHPHQCTPQCKPSPYFLLPSLAGSPVAAKVELVTSSISQCMEKHCFCIFFCNTWEC